MATFECYACHATVREGMRNCVGCGAEQTRAALEAFRARRAVRLAGERWRLICAIVGLTGLAIGVGFGTFVGRRSVDALPSPPTSVATNSLPRAISIEQVNDGFMRSINETLRTSEGGRVLEFGAVSWIWGSDSTYVIELASPTPEQPGLWHVLDSEQRYQLMGFLSVAYTRTLLGAGIPVDLSQSHPALALKYRDSPTALAVRQRDGTIRVFSSPFEPPHAAQQP